MQLDEILNSTATFILAGGRGERLDPLTRHRSKPAVPFGNGRIIDLTLGNCRRSGLRHPRVLTQYRHESLHRHVDTWSLTSPADLTPVCVPPAPGRPYRGTANALGLQFHLAESSRYTVVLSADHIYEMDYRRLLQAHIERNADVTVAATVVSRRDATGYGVIDAADDLRIRAFEEKPPHPKGIPGRPSDALASMGVYVFNTDVLAELLGGATVSTPMDIGRNLIPAALERHRLVAYPFENPRTGAPLYWRDVGTLDAYFAATREWLGVRSWISAGASVHPTARVTDSIIFAGVRVGRGAVIRRAILDEGVTVEAGSELSAESVDHAVVRTPGGIAVAPQDARIEPDSAYTLQTVPAARSGLRRDLLAGVQPW